MAGPQLGEEFSPGQEVKRSGIYRVVHDYAHADPHEVTCVFGKRFPPCHYCGEGVRYVLVRGAQHVEQNEHFK